MSLAARALSSFCYSARPQWDDFGHLRYSSAGQHGETLSLAQRFGPQIWKGLEGKRVLDYGCGYGADVQDCARHGLDAAGLEIREFLVEGARSRAERAGLACSFYHTSERDRLAGAFDCIVSVNCFEHYLDPAAVLKDMSRLLRLGGLVLVYFSPPWLHPYGAHTRQMSALPWIHLLFPESAVLEVRSHYYDEKPTCYEEAAGGLSRMTVAKFKRVVGGSPFAFRSFELLAIRKMTPMTKIPLLRELFTGAVRAELVPRPTGKEAG